MGPVSYRRSEPTDVGGAEVRGERILASNSGRCVEESYQTAYNLGCGSRHWPGWINVDLAPDADIRSDLRNLDAIPSDSADAVAAIHVLEHFHEWEALPLIQEWRRVLKPGGKMILELPCLNKICYYVAKCVQDKLPLDETMLLHPLFGSPKERDPLMGHKWGYFKETLRVLLERAGLREIQFVTPRYHFPMRDMRVECVK